MPVLQKFKIYSTRSEGSTGAITSSVPNAAIIPPSMIPESVTKTPISPDR